MDCVSHSRQIMSTGKAENLFNLSAMMLWNLYGVWFTPWTFHLYKSTRNHHYLVGSHISGPPPTDHRPKEISVQHIKLDRNKADNSNKNELQTYTHTHIYIYLQIHKHKSGKLQCVEVKWRRRIIISIESTIYIAEKNCLCWTSNLALDGWFTMGNWI